MRDQNAAIFKKRLREKVSANETRSLLIPSIPMHFFSKNWNAEAKGKRIKIISFLLKPGPSVKKMTCKQRHLKILIFGAKTHFFSVVRFILKLDIR